MTDRATKSDRHVQLLSQPGQLGNEWTTPSRTYAACNDGPCKQGRGICHTPEACQLAEDQKRDTRNGHVIWLLVAALLTLAAYGVANYLAGGL